MESTWQTSPAQFRSWSLDSKACILPNIQNIKKTNKQRLYFPLSTSSKGEPGEKGQKGAPGRPGRVGPPGETGIYLYFFALETK